MGIRSGYLGLGSFRVRDGEGGLVSWRGWCQAAALQHLMGAQVLPVQSRGPSQMGKGFLGAGSPSRTQRGGETPQASLLSARQDPIPRVLLGQQLMSSVGEGLLENQALRIPSPSPRLTSA